jgi:HK97 gp10 family phage protein
MGATVKGADALLRKLQFLPSAMREAIRNAMADQADEVVAMMKRLVPVESGDLRDSIGWRWGSRAPKGSMAVASVSSGLGGLGKDLQLTIFAGSSEAFYARWVEFGTVKMPGRPFFFVSWRASRKSVRRKMRAATRIAARQVAAG